MTKLHDSRNEYKVLCHGVSELSVDCFYYLAHPVQFEADEQAPDYE